VICADRQLLAEAEAVCIEAVREAGAVLMDFFRQPLPVEFKEKGQQAPVTEADRRSEELLRTALRRAFPEHGIIGEEDEGIVNAGAEYVWFLDPLDGTANFAAGLPAFAVSMGLCFRGVPVLGVVSIPWEGPAGTVFRAYQGSGAYCNSTAVTVAPAELPASMQLASMPFWAFVQYRVGRQARLRQANVRAHGSIAYELVYAARGAFQFSIISGARLWDMVAGVVLVQEAGGATLFGNGKMRRWNNWETFLQRVLARPFGEDSGALRKLHIDILAGNSHIVQQRAGHIRRRQPTLLSKTRHHVRRTWQRLKPALPTATPSKDVTPSLSQS
jgi:myo-inositol-1(or 4)-monophosphatase